jgi:hypothetical protein
MKKQRTSPSRDVKSGQYVLSSKRGERISAVEGMHLTPRMRDVMVAATSRGLSGDERRTLIKEQIRKK